MDFLEAALDPADEEHRDMVRWYGGPFNAIGFDEARARFDMENMARRRRGPLASHSGGYPASETINAARWVAGRVDAGVTVELRFEIARQRRGHSRTVQTLKKSEFGLMTDFYF